MKTKFYRLTLIGLLFVPSVFSQTEEFQLTEYKLPDMKRNQLDLTFDVAGNTSASKNTMNTTTTKPYRSNFGGNVYLFESSYFNSRKRQQNANYAFFMDAGKSYFGDENTFAKSLDLQTSLSTSQTNRFYHNLSFFECDLDASFQLDKSKQSSSSSPSETTTTKSLHGFVPLKIGIGRIEQVQDARQAIYILDALSKENRIRKTISKEEILEFSRLISSVKNKRFFDSRIKKMYEIETLDSFLIAKDLKDKSDARFYTTLRDFWDYGSQQIRESGSRFSFGVIPGYVHRESVSAKTANLFILNSAIEYNYEKPINQQWQNSLSAQWLFGLSRYHEKNNTYPEQNIPVIRLGVNQTLKYYPNTRTDASFSYSANYVRVINSQNSTSLSGNKSQYLTASAECSANYYVSPQLRISAVARLGYHINEAADGRIYANYGNNIDYVYLDGSSYAKYTNFGTNFYIRLTYSIF